MGEEVGDSRTVHVVHRQPAGRSRERTRAQGHLGDGAETPVGADHQPAQIEPTHVLDRRAATLDDVAPSGHDVHLQHGVPHGSATETQVIVPAGGQGAAHRSVRVAELAEVHVLAPFREDVIEIGQSGSRSAGHGHLVGFEGTDAGRCLDGPKVPGRFDPRTRAANPHLSRRTDAGGEFVDPVHTHRPST